MFIHAHTKTLVKAIPVIDTDTNKVKSWEITVTYKADSNGWETTYNHKADVEALNKAVEDFTKSELVGMMPQVLSDHVFDAHFEANNAAPVEVKEQVLSDFNTADLDD